MSTANTTYEQYMQDISRYARIDPEREVVLSEIIQAGTNDEQVEAAIEELTTANLLLVLHCLKDFRSYLSAASCCITEMDLIAEGNVALMNAARHFDAHRGGETDMDATEPIRFSSYACKIIKNAMRRALKLARLVHVPEYHFKCWTQLDELEEAYGGSLTDERAARELGVRQPVVRMLRKSREIGVSSLEAIIPEDDSSWNDLIADQRAPSPSAEVAGKDLHAYLTEELKELPQRTRRMLSMMYMRESKATLAELSEVFGVSMERCRQVCARGLSILQQNMTRRIEKVLGRAIYEQEASELALAVAEWLEPRMPAFHPALDGYAAEHDAA